MTCRQPLQIDVKASFPAKEIGQLGFFTEIAPGRHRLLEQGGERVAVAARGLRQGFPDEACQPWEKRGQGDRPDGERTFRIEEKPRQIAQDVGVAHRHTGVGSECAGIAGGSSRGRLVRIDDDDLAAARRQPKRGRQSDDAGSDDRDISLERPNHSLLDRSGDFEMAGI